MTISECSLEAEELPEGLDPDYWQIKKDGDKILIKPVEWWFKWGNWFIEDLKTMAKAGVKGEIAMYGEFGEWVKYVLKDGTIEEYEGEVVFTTATQIYKVKGE